MRHRGPPNGHGASRTSRRIKSANADLMLAIGTPGNVGLFPVEAHALMAGWRALTRADPLRVTRGFRTKPKVHAR